MTDHVFCRSDHHRDVGVDVGGLLRGCARARFAGADTSRRGPRIRIPRIPSRAGAASTCRCRRDHPYRRDVGRHLGQAGCQVAVGVRRRHPGAGRHDRHARVLLEEGLRTGERRGPGDRPAARRRRCPASRRFYADHGFSVGKSYGRKYVEFDTRPISFTLNRRGDLAKTAGVAADGSGAHRLLIHGDGESFTDPDGYVWERRETA